MSATIADIPVAVGRHRMSEPWRAETGRDRGIPLAVVDAVVSVCDPEYPDLSIVDLGLVVDVIVRSDTVEVTMIPTFSGCPALDYIGADVREAVRVVDGVQRCEVVWLRAPSWSIERVSERARSTLAEDYTVAVRDVAGALVCPVCGSRDLRDQAMAGATRCRSVAWCPTCRNPIEVMR